MNGIIGNYSYNQGRLLTQPQSVGFGNKFEKLCEKFLSGSKNITGEDAATVLARLGYKLGKNGGSSHHIWRNAKGHLVNVAVHNPKQELKTYQVREIAEAIRQAGRLSAAA
jgi:predicted RNA binding protein YcfA (HicA-like mRNA interferase family)